MAGYAILHGFSDDVSLSKQASALQVVAHVSGNSIDVLHCPFCGSGALVARSDGTIECNYCTAVFTVQVQPQYPAFPQTSQGQPYAWPGQPDPSTVVSPGGSPAAPGDPMAGGFGGAPTDINADSAGAPMPGMDGPTDGTGGDSGNPFADGGDDEDSDDDPTAQIGGKSAPPFAKKDKGDKKKDDGKKGDNPFAKKKSSSDPMFYWRQANLRYRTAAGALLGDEDYVAHLAILHADDPAKVAAAVRDSR